MKEISCEVAVIGGGAAGMVAAVYAARALREQGNTGTVLVIEKNKRLGEKLLITGGGRCNITNLDPDPESFLAKYGAAKKFLRSAFARHDVSDSVAFFKKLGVRMIVENEYRAFPHTQRAETVWEALTTAMTELDIQIVSNSPVASIQVADGRINRLTMLNGTHVRAKRYILATGGLSHPETGSTGDGFTWLRELGHTVRSDGAALVPLSLRDPWVKRLAGVSLSDVRIHAKQNGVRRASREGRMIFTHVGASGPAVLNISAEVGDMLRYGPVDLEFDILPHHSEEEVGTLLLELFGKFSNKLVRNCLPEIIPTALAPVVMELAGVDAETPAHSCQRESRLALARTIKRLPATVKGLLGLGKAIIASGGVALKEIDFKTMQSLKIENLHITGDLLDVERPSGGYSLQLCWTTGAVAGAAATADIKNDPPLATEGRD